MASGTGQTTKEAYPNHGKFLRVVLWWKPAIGALQLGLRPVPLIRTLPSTALITCEPRTTLRPT